MKHILRLVNYYKNTITSKHNQHFLPFSVFIRDFGLYQRPLSQEVCSILLLVLGTIVMQHGKKSVIQVAQRVAALVPVQGLSSFFSIFEKKDDNR